MGRRKTKRDRVEERRRIDKAVLEAFFDEPGYFPITHHHSGRVAAILAKWDPEFTEAEFDETCDELIEKIGIPARRLVNRKTELCYLQFSKDGELKQIHESGPRVWRYWICRILKVHITKPKK